MEHHTKNETHGLISHGNHGWWYCLRAHMHNYNDDDNGGVSLEGGHTAATCNRLTATCSLVF